MKEHVILVDEFDRQIGVEEKLQAHYTGKLHRAFSIFLFNSNDELLLQRRARHKYHSGGLWSNTCCGHPRPDEHIEEAASRRLWEEMGISAPLWKSFDFIYNARVSPGLTEHEFDHVFIGHHAGDITPNPDEVMAYRWLGISDLRTELSNSPQNHTIWFRTIWERVIKNRQSLHKMLQNV